MDPLILSVIVFGGVLIGFFIWYIVTILTMPSAKEFYKTVHKVWVEERKKIAAERAEKNTKE